jgi:DNA-binding HxlR family transcriptional regulator
MPSKRTYGDPCGIARALDLVGERWALLVVRELVLGPKRFTDLRAGLANLSPDVLSQRLRGLEGAGIVRRRTLPPPAASRVYELTDWGRELEPVVLALGRWGSRAPFPPGDEPLGIDALILALRTLFDPRAADGLRASYELRLGEQRFHARVAGGAPARAPSTPTRSSRPIPPRSPRCSGTTASSPLPRVPARSGSTAAGLWSNASSSCSRRPSRLRRRTLPCCSRRTRRVRS